MENNANIWEQVIEAAQREDDLPIDELRALVEADEKAVRDRLAGIRERAQQAAQDRVAIEVRRVVGW